MASIPVAAANQTAQLGTEPPSALQAQTATTKVPQFGPIQDTVTLSHGVPQPTPAEEAGLFQVAAPAIPRFSPASLSGASNGAAPRAAENAAAVLNAPPASGAALAAPAAQHTPTAQPPANNINSAVVNAGAAPAAKAPPAKNFNVILVGKGTVAPADAPQPAATLTAATAQHAPAPSTHSQNQLLQFTEYLQQLGLPPQAQNQMIEAARLLNELDPPAFQQAIVALRAEAASLAANSGNATAAPTQTANTAPNHETAPT